MRFDVRGLSLEDYKVWLASTKRSTEKLDAIRYAALDHPSRADKPLYFGQVDVGLFDGIVHNHGASQAASTTAQVESRKLPEEAR
jgi:hypothetical protein